MVKLTVDKEVLSDDEDILFSDKMTRKTLDIIYKPELKSSFAKSNVKKIYNEFTQGNEKIKRIVVEGKGNNGKIKLDTEGIKLFKYIDTKLSFDGLVDSDDIFSKYESLINTFNEQIVNLVFEETAAGDE